MIAELTLSHHGCDDFHVSFEDRVHPSKEIYVVPENYVRRLQAHFGLPHPFPRDYLIKIFVEGVRASTEFQVLTDLQATSLFYRFPWALNTLLEGKNYTIIDEGKYKSKPSVRAILMEFVNAPSLATHFSTLPIDAIDPRLILLQFCRALLDSFKIITFLHSHRKVFHRDIKSENLLFANNILKLIDFEDASQGVPAHNYGTLFNLPNQAILLRSKRANAYPNPIQSWGRVDVYCWATTFLEVLANQLDTVCMIPREIKRVYSIKAAIEEKWNAKPINGTEGLEYATRISEHMKANDALAAILRRWMLSHPTNQLVKIFCKSLSEPLSAKSYDEITNIVDGLSPQTLFADIAQLRIARDLPRRLPGTFVHSLRWTLSSFTSNVFADHYPAIYLDLSEKSKCYDNPARAAAEHAKKLLATSGEKPGICLDVGCGYGTAGFQAAKVGFEEVVLLDNNPHFQRLAELLWSGDVALTDQGDKSLSSVVGGDLASFGAVYLGMGSDQPDEVRRYFVDLIHRKRCEFAGWRDRVLNFDLAEYWSIHDRLPAFSRRFGHRPASYIVCNNMLHWPVIDLEQLWREVGDSRAPAIAPSDLLRVLYPALASPGVLAIIEPSIFLVDDLNIAEKDGPNVRDDEAFHAQRFSESSEYQNWRKDAASIFEEIFLDVGSLKDVSWFKPDSRKPRFYTSRLLGDLKEVGADLAVECTARKFEGKENWRTRLLGSFFMMLRDLNSTQLADLKNNRKKFLDFYRKLSHLVEQYEDKLPKRLIDTIYTVYVIRR